MPIKYLIGNQFFRVGGGAALLVPTAGVLPVFLLGGMSVQVTADLRFGTTGLGAASAVFFGAASANSAFAGRLVDRIGALRGMRIGCALAVTALLAAATVARNLPLLLACLALGGLANSLCQPGANALIAGRVPVARQGLAFAAKQCAIPLATMLGGLAVPALALTVGWRWAFAAGALLALAAFALIPGGGGVTAAERDRVRPDTLPVRPLALLAAAGGLGAAGGNAIGSFLVASAVDAGFGERAAGLLLSAASVLILVTRLTAGVLADRRGSGFFAMTATLLAVGAAGFALLGTGAASLFLAGTVVAAVAGWGWPGLFNLAVVAENRAAAARATGITQTGVYLGAVGGPLAFGAVAEHAGFPAAWWLSASCALVGAAMMVAGGRALRRASSAAV